MPTASAGSRENPNQAFPEEVTTIFVVGFPDDITEREFQNMFMFAPGFEGATLKIPQSLQDPDSYHQEPSSKKQIIGFAKFGNKNEALAAKDLLNGRRIDPEKYTVLKAEIAKKNLHKKRGAFTNEVYTVTMTNGSEKPASGDSTVSGSASPALASEQQDASSFAPEIETPDRMDKVPLTSQIVSSGMLSRPTTPAGLLNLQPLLPALNMDNEQPKKDDTLYIHSPPTIPLDMLNNASENDVLESFSEKNPLLSRTSSTHSLNDYLTKFAARPVDLNEKLSLSRTPSGTFSPFFDVSPFGGEFSGPPNVHQKQFFDGSSQIGFPSALDPLSTGSRFGFRPPFTSIVKQGQDKSRSDSAQLDCIPLSHPAHRGTADQNPPCNTLYVGNLPPETFPEELEALFSVCKGYKRLCFRNRLSGPMCFVEFEDIPCAAQAMQDLYGVPLSTHTKGGIRLSFSKNPLGVRPNGAQMPTMKPPAHRSNSSGPFLPEFANAESAYETPRSSPSPNEQHQQMQQQYHPMHSQHQPQFHNALAFGNTHRPLSASSSPNSMISGSNLMLNAQQPIFN